MEVVVVLGLVGLILWHLAKGKSRRPPTWEEAPTASDWAQPPIGSARATYVLNGPCWVVDGDTIRIGTTSIRLAGIDAPELDHPWGNKAKWALHGLCKGKVIRAEFHGEQTYLREVATCFLPDGRDLAAEMVKMGMAIDWPKYSGGKYRALEVVGVRKKLWRCDARQKGLMPPASFGR